MLYTVKQKSTVRPLNTGLIVHRKTNKKQIPVYSYIVEGGVLFTSGSVNWNYMRSKCEHHLVERRRSHDEWRSEE